jgi:Pol polyprotein/integrase-like protein
MDKLPSHFYYLHQKEWLQATGEGFEDWKDSMLRLLDYHDLKHIIEEPEDLEKALADKETRQSFKQSSLMILNSVDTAVRRTVIADCKYPWEMLNKLNYRYGTPKTLQKHMMRQRFIEYQWDSSTTPEEMLQQYQRLIIKCETEKIILDDSEKISKLLSLTRARMPIWTTQAVSQWARDPKLKIGALYDDFAVNAKQESMSIGAETALMADKKGKKPKQCTHCKRKGHLEPQCWQKHPELKPERLIKRSERGSNEKKTSEPENNSKNDKKMDTKKNQPEELGLMVFQDKAALSARSISRSVNQDAWILDHGATTHLCNNKLLFSDYVSINQEIATAGGSTKSFGRGTVRIRLFSRSAGTRIARLSNVLYVPSLPANLLSHSTLESKGIVYDPYERDLRHRDSKESLCDVTMDSGLYVVNTSPIKPQIKALSVTEHENRPIETAYMSNAPSAGTLHQRFAHAGITTIKHIYKDVKDDIPHCIGCQMGDAKQQISRDKQKYSAKPMEKIHVDTIGPIEPRGSDGSLYIMTITDDHSRSVWAFALLSKIQAATALRDFLNRMANTATPISCIRIDNGTEFGGKHYIDNLTKSLGISVEYTVPYTHEENGIAEATNRLILSRARRMLIEAHLPQYL